uniref:Uncharacterized protein n=1 Tax=Oryza punctata TaxID=4537 RepID=A0A0E0M1S2_ORYPU
MVSLLLGAATPVGSGYAYLHSNKTRCPKGSLNYCVAGKRYLPVSNRTPAIPTLKVFDNREDEGRPTSCNICLCRNMELVIALSSGWPRLDGGGVDCRRRCNRRIRVAATAYGWSIVVRVVNECDSVNGCRDEDGFSPPCRDNVGDGSPALWKKLGLNESVRDFLAWY